MGSGFVTGISTGAYVEWWAGARRPADLESFVELRDGLRELLRHLTGETNLSHDARVWHLHKEYVLIVGIMAVVLGVIAFATCCDSYPGPATPGK